MRKLIMFMLLAIPLMAGAAYAANDSGIVSNVNTRTGILVLSDGASYYVPNRLTLSTLRQGDVVRVSYERREGGPVASNVVKTGKTARIKPVITPARGSGMQSNFTAGNDMCKATATDKNPCFLGAQ